MRFLFSPDADGAQSVEEILAGPDGDAVSQEIQDATADADGQEGGEQAEETAPEPVKAPVAPAPKFSVGRLGREIDANDPQALREALIRLDEISRSDQSQARRLDAELKKLREASASAPPRREEEAAPPPKSLADAARTALGEFFHTEALDPLGAFGEEIKKQAIAEAKDYILKEFYPALWNQLQPRLPDEAERSERQQAIWLRECAEIGQLFGSNAPADLIAQAHDAIIAREEEAGRPVDLNNHRVRRAVEKAAVDFANTIFQQRQATQTDNKSPSAPDKAAARANGSPQRPPVSRTAPKPGADTGGKPSKITAASQEDVSVEAILATL